jgi:tetratricopeptide (TPR) repeat protein
MALAMAVLLLLGSWAFPEGLGLACVCGISAAYFHVMSRRRMRVVPDPAKMIEVAVELAHEGKVDRAIALLTKEIGRSPKFWQAYQYRGHLYLLQGAADLALRDIDEAMRLAPNEPDLLRLRDAAIAVPTMPAPGVPAPPPADR